MACRINRNTEGKITSVDTPNNTESLLFKEINSNPFMSDTEVSLTAYMNMYSEKVQSANLEMMESGEPKLHYKTPDNKVFDDLETAIISNSKGKIRAGFLEAGTENLMDVFSFNTQASKESIFINDKIQEGLLSAERVLGADGVNRFQAKGEFLNTKELNAIILKDRWRGELGNPNVTVNNKGEVEVDQSEDFTTVEWSNGTTEVVHKSLVPEYLDREGVTNKASLFSEHFIDNLVEETVQSSEETANIKDSLMRFLADMGFTTTSLDRYSAAFKTKHGQDPDIDALADIANKIVAFSRGEITMDSLSEEVAHIAIELYNDQNSIVEAMANVVLTPEYAEYSEYYRQKYSENYEGQQLEKMVRKEVLGKILKKQFASRFEMASEVRSPLQNIWNTIVEYFKSRIKPYHRRQIDLLNDRIADSVLENKTEEFQFETQENAVFYNAQNNSYKKMQDELVKQKRHYEDLFKNALKETVPNRAELENIINLTNEVDIVATAATMVGIADSQTTALQGRVERATRRGEAISRKDENAFNLLEGDLVPSMNHIGNLLKREIPNMKSDRMVSQAQSLVETLKTVGERMDSIKPEISENRTNVVVEAVNEELDKSSLDEDTKVEVRKTVFGGIPDNTVVGMLFGLASQSKNVLIQLLHRMALQINVKTRAKFNKEYNRFVGEVVGKDLMKHQADLLYKDENGKATHYMRSFRDYHSDEVAIDKKSAEILSEKTGLKVDEVQKLLERSTAEEILIKHLGAEKAPVELQDYFNQRSDYRRTLKERPRTEEYYEKAQERFDKANVDDSTIRYLRTRNVAKAERDKNFLDENGNLDNSLKSEDDLRLDMNDRRDYNIAKNAIDASGHMKEGLAVKPYSELTEAELAMIPEGVKEVMAELDFVGDVTIPTQPVEELSVESRRALDMQNLNFIYRGEMKDGEKGTAKEGFWNKLSELDKENKAYDWVTANTNMHFTSEYYKNMGDGENYTSIVTEYIDGLPEGREKQEKKDTLERIESLKRSRRNVLKQNRKPNSAVETDVAYMTDLTRATIRELDGKIRDAQIDLRLPNEVNDQLGEIEFQGESSLNEDFWKMHTEHGGSVYDFALGHMTSWNKNRTETFGRQVEDYILGRRYTLDPEFERFVEKHGKGVGQGTDAQRVAELKDLYAQSKVASYYKRYQPEGYTEMLEAMKSGDLSMEDAIRKTPEALLRFPALEFIEITPDYAWQNDVSNDDMVNDNYQKRGLANQPKKLVDSTFEFFGIAKEDYLALEDEDISKLTPTKNKEAFELLVMLTDAHKDIHKRYGITDGNPYELQQISNGRMEKMFNLKSAKENTVDLVTDVFRSKRDEKEYGEMLDNGTNIKSIPKYYQDRLESPEIVSKNLMTSAMLSLEEAIRYEERVKAEDKVRAVEYQIGEQKLVKKWGSRSKNRITGKGQVSNTHKRAQDMVDNMLYGIRQSRKMVVDIGGMEIDLTQMFTNLTKYSTVLNLALSPITELTSYTTGLYNNIIDTYVEEYYSKSAGVWASKKMPKMLFDYIQEGGQFTKESELSHLMEFMGVMDASDKINESLRSLPVRVIDKSYFALAKLANLPVTPRNMLAVLKDYKWYAPEGRFISKNDFIRIQKRENKAIQSSAIDQRWSKMEDSFYDNLTVDKKKGVQMSSKFRDKFKTEAEAEAAFEDYQVRLTSKIQSINQNIDSVMSKEDQVLAKRDVAFSAFLQHRSFFIINMTKAFKGRMVNLSTGQVESGHFSSMLKIAAEAFKNRKDLRNYYNNQLEEQERRNIKRLFGSSAAFAILAAAMHGLDDIGDDEDDYALKFAQLIGLRTTAESMSLTPLGLAGEALGMYKDPIPQSKLFTNLYKSGESLYEQDIDAFYENIGKNMLFTRRWGQLSDMDNQVNSYKHFNKETLGLIGLHE